MNYPSLEMLKVTTQDKICISGTHFLGGLVIHIFYSEIGAY